MAEGRTAAYQCMHEVGDPPTWQVVGGDTSPSNRNGFGFDNEQDCLNAEVDVVRLTSYNAVQILHAGEWRFVCDDAWGMDDAHVVCRELGLGEATEALGRIGLPNSRFWLDDVGCSGTETRLADCSATDWGTHNCASTEGAGARSPKPGAVRSSW